MDGCNFFKFTMIWSFVAPENIYTLPSPHRREYKFQKGWGGGGGVLKGQIKRTLLKWGPNLENRAGLFRSRLTLIYDKS